MDDYIKREDAIKAFCSAECGEEPCVGEDACASVIAVRDFPSADVVEVVRGEWIDMPLYFTTFQGTVNDGYTYCNCCKKKFDYGHRRNFCDECGADMRKEK